MVLPYPMSAQFYIFGPPENIRKPQGSLMLSGGPKMEHWADMG